jgi:hypothetical protein
LGRNLASWKLLEDMMLELKVAGVEVPAKTVDDLRTAKSMLQLGCMPQSGDAVQKAEELMANVEAFLATESQRAFGEAKADGWLEKLEEANSEICSEPDVEEEKFVTGVPRDMKWVRIETKGDLTTDIVGQLATDYETQVKVQPDGKLVVYGSLDNLKAFIKRIAAEKLKP